VEIHSGPVYFLIMTFFGLIPNESAKSLSSFLLLLGRPPALKKIQFLVL